MVGSASIEQVAGQRPLRRDAERNRQRIMAAAREVFAERGLTATLDDVAHRAGLGVGTVYRRFPNKDVLIQALFQQRMDEVGKLAERSLTAPDAWRGFAGFVTGVCEMAASDRGLRDLTLSSNPHQEHLEDAKARFAPTIRALVERAKREGALRPEIETEDIPPLLIMVNAVTEYTGVARPGLWRRYLAMLLDGLATERGEPVELPEPLDMTELTEVMRAWDCRRF